MKVLQQWIIMADNQFQLMAYIGKGQYYITDTGGFGQRPMTWRNILASEAENYIIVKDEIPKDY